MIYVVRHTLSEANIDPRLYLTTPNESVQLAEEGIKDAEKAAEDLASSIDDSFDKNRNRYKPIIFTSPFKRCIQTAEILASKFEEPTIRPNLLISEMNCGEHEGCNVEDFHERPVEKHYYDLLGGLRYKPLRGESFLDLHVRAGLFIMQQDFFRYVPIAIIVSHASVCLMLHYFMINECPPFDCIDQKAKEYWNNGHIRKYEKSPCRYLGAVR